MKSFGDGASQKTVENILEAINQIISVASIQSLQHLHTSFLIHKD
jgi:hypothetical protein